MNMSLSQSSHIMYFGWYLSYWWRLFLLWCDFERFGLFNLFFSVALSVCRDKLVRSNNSLVVWSHLKPKWARFFEVIIVVLCFFIYDHVLFRLKVGCDRGLRLGKGFWCASFATLCNIFLWYHRMITDVFWHMISPRDSFVFLLFLDLALVFSVSPWSFVFYLYFYCVIIAIWQSVDHFLYIIVPHLPIAYVCVHVLDKSAWRCSFELGRFYFFPNRIYILQVCK